MKNSDEINSVLLNLLTSARVVLATVIICSLAYPLIILAAGQLLSPKTANGSLVYDSQGNVVGSLLIAQSFSRPEYFRPRPSAVDYNAAATGGSNLSPTNPKLQERAQTIISLFNASATTPVPADLVSASGSGLDPHITVNAAKYQAARVASARKVPQKTVMELIEKHALRVLSQEPLVNVLAINIDLDKMKNN
ncbi:MAG TPA: potassium-transporting ATPase subunit KdpC [Thermodesulfovibrionia bacterium]|nr:potassium-transporting ATPase subunit KdpC [Thermodesulfovibrionia bacterium]